MSLEYSMFRFADDYPTAEGLSEMIMQVCMDDDSQGDDAERLIYYLVNAAYHLRCIEQLRDTDADEPEVPVAHNAEELYMSLYAKACKAIGEPCNEGDAWWEDWWPTMIRWHPEDIARLARLQAGETRAVRRQLREEFLKAEGKQ